MFSSLNIEKDNKCSFFLCTCRDCLHGFSWLWLTASRQRMTGGFTVVSMVPLHWALLRSPFRARPLGSKPAHSAVHRFTSRVIVLVPQCTTRSLLSKQKGRSQCQANCREWRTVAKSERLTWNPVIHRGAVIGRVNGLQDESQCT